ncbi:ABC-2 type transport system permease protein [Ruminococcus sp. YRD2003]|uniref:ABC transporter permease n=1 Tax=Ruminococcus sp. YRD2003 TaxID=1452313 RepID=UPI0008CBC268|nr:ABC-2 type transport system permease protein [Ruminococcus flavefaciens]
MFLHNLLYEIKSSLRVRDLIFWLILFPIILGTFFKIAFGSLYEKQTKVTAIPTAIVETADNEVFRSVIESVSGTDEALLDAEYLSEDEALKKLKDGDIKGIIYSGDKLTLTVSGDGAEQSVLKLFVEQYMLREKIITDTMTSDPSKMQAVIAALSEEINTSEEAKLTNGNLDFYIQYFYNLIAMVAMYGSVTGLHVAIGQQANLSELGARKNCSATPKSVGILASLTGTWIVQSICMIICVSFTAFVLKVDYGDRLPLVYVAAICGGILGVSFGFFIGSIGRMKQGAKVGICMSVSMTMCFLSGLMVANMKPIMAEKAPWFNNINPAALVTDSISALNLYSGYRVFVTKILTMLVISLIFYILGLLMVRRRKYASL